MISGQAPLSVSFNLCESSGPEQVPGAPDQGDSITWQFHFGDGETQPFAADGSFQPDFEHFCRTDHTYSEQGRFVATLSVTDKHLEDQGGDVEALARTTTRVTIEVASADAGGPGGCPAAPQSSSLWQSQTVLVGLIALPQYCFCPVTGVTLDFNTYRSQVCIAAGFNNAVWSSGQPCGCITSVPN